jgi:hypothetical protein
MSACNFTPYCSFSKIFLSLPLSGKINVLCKYFVIRRMDEVGIQIDELASMCISAKPISMFDELFAENQTADWAKLVPAIKDEVAKVLDSLPDEKKTKEFRVFVSFITEEVRQKINIMAGLENA